MLVAIRNYIKSFYESLRSKSVRSKSLKRRKGSRPKYGHRSTNDPPALLTFGILLEEAVLEMLGDQGHLVFTESADADDVAAKAAAACHTKRSADVAAGGSVGVAYSTDGYDEMLSIPRAKRHKTEDGRGGDEVTSGHDDESRGECDAESEPHNQSQQAACQPGTIATVRKLLTAAPKRRRRLGMFDL
ncbi:hypothetical protein CDD80_1411 [Ophiocordyceps camponoti-rufipedis]|uniref:Uncharacterized protein n=1 Tax=Ophiocordyceps camponoti-rufipedis TaxID=2004952 RepID=A0A2C5Z9Y0_9HYPO|nr:hypothetical protein CDD80_1411 [Ophiocordyceps camponoti-rufipedis]